MRGLAACSAFSLGAISSYGMSPIAAEPSAGLSGQTGRTFCCGYAARSATPAAAKAVRGLNVLADGVNVPADAATGTARTATVAADAATRTSRVNLVWGTECWTSNGLEKRWTARGDLWSGPRS